MDTDLNKILQEDQGWYKTFQSMEVTGKCDNIYCTDKAKYWHTNTARAHCGNDRCIEFLDNERDEISKRLDEDD